MLDEGFKVNFLRRLYLADLDLISNGGFETAGTGDPDFWADWTEAAGTGVLANETSLQYEGSDAAKITAGGTPDTWIYQLVTTVPNKQYRLRFWTRGDGTHGGRYRIRDVSNLVWITDMTDTGVTGATYTAVVREFTFPAECILARIYFYAPITDGGIAYYDACDLYLLN